MTPPRQVEALAGRTGLPTELIAILLIIAGILVIVFPAIIAWVVGLTLVVLGVWWLVDAFRARRDTETARTPPTAP